MIEKTYTLFGIRNVPKSVNAGGGGHRANRYVAAKEKKQWEGTYLMELLAAKAERSMQFCTVHVTICWKHHNRRDIENYRHPVVKPLLDALVKGGYLKDDTEEWVQVGEFRFEYPEEWPFTDPRVQSYMDIRLEAQYA